MDSKVGEKPGRLLHTVTGKRTQESVPLTGAGEVTVRFSHIWEGFVGAAGLEEPVEFTGPGRPSGWRGCEPRPRMER